MCAPEKIVIEFIRGRSFKAPYFQAGRVKAGAKIFDRAIFSARIHRLKNQQQTSPVFSIQNLLQLVDFFAELRKSRRPPFLCIRMFRWDQFLKVSFCVRGMW